jgi:hypothetical protein
MRRGQVTVWLQGAAGRKAEPALDNGSLMFVDCPHLRSACPSCPCWPCARPVMAHPCDGRCRCRACCWIRRCRPSTRPSSSWSQTAWILWGGWSGPASRGKQRGRRAPHTSASCQVGCKWGAVEDVCGTVVRGGGEEGRTGTLGGMLVNSGLHRV